jgi:hypothetical protein
VPAAGSAGDGAAGGGDRNMGKRGIVFVGSIALIALLSGCGQRAPTNAGTEPDGQSSALPSDIVGTWNGSVGSSSPDAGGGGATGNITLTVNDDGAYHTITLRSSSGKWASLVQRGALYVVMPDQVSGYTLQISVVKDSGTLGGPVSAPSDRQ